MCLCFALFVQCFPLLLVRSKHILAFFHYCLSFPCSLRSLSNCNCVCVCVSVCVPRKLCHSSVLFFLIAKLFFLRFSRCVRSSRQIVVSFFFLFTFFAVPWFVYHEHSLPAPAPLIFGCVWPRGTHSLQSKGESCLILVLGGFGKGFAGKELYLFLALAQPTMVA